MADSMMEETIPPPNVTVVRSPRHWDGAASGFFQVNEFWTLPEIFDECRQRELCVHRVRCEADGGRLALDLAARAYGKPTSVLEASSDPYSQIYLASQGDRVVGTITVTYARDGRLSTEEFLPPVLLKSQRAVACSAYRLAVDPNVDTRGLAKLLMRISFADGVANGMRLALVTARTEMAAYYRRVGYLQLKGSEFIHPRLKAQHLVFACPTDPDHRSIFSDICRSLPNPFRRSALEEYLGSD